MEPDLTMEDTYRGMSVALMRKVQSLEREVQALEATVVVMGEALKVARLWLANCVPTTEIEGQKPLPLIDEAISNLPERVKALLT